MASNQRTQRNRATQFLREHGYFRASTATGIPGTGIGLSLVKDLTEAYQGGLEVNSLVRQGTEFIIYLPTNGPAGEGNPQ